jgi:hypothetical protein
MIDMHMATLHGSEEEEGGGGGGGGQPWLLQLHMWVAISWVDFMDKGRGTDCTVTRK